MKAKKMLAGLLSAAMVISSMALPVFADETKADDAVVLMNGEEGAAQNAETDETGTVVAKIGENKYTDLAMALNAAVSGGTVVLQKDITLTGEWTPIAGKFSGTLDGNNKTIRGLTITNGTNYCGLIGSLYGGTVKDLTIDGANITTADKTQYAGALFGSGWGDIENCTVSNSTITGYDQVGGLGGYFWIGTITGCTLTNNTIIATSERAGGILGKGHTDSANSGGGISITNCTVSDGSATAPDYAGGLMAQFMGDQGAYDISGNAVNDITLSAKETGNLFTIRLESKSNQAFMGALLTNIKGNTVNGVAVDTTINVTASNAQDVLDGRYGDITGKTINFTENIDTVLDLARPTAYKGSNTTYWKNADNDLSNGYEAEVTWSDSLVADLGTGTCVYYRTLEDVTFTANDGVEIAGFTFGAGHVAGSGKDYVRSTDVTDNNNGYYRHSSMEDITFKGLTFTDIFDATFSLADCTVKDITFDSCTFKGNTNNMSNTGFVAIHTQTDNGKCENITVKDCVITNYYQGIYTQGCSGTTKITGNYISNTTHNGLALQSGTSSPVRGTVVVKNNYISDARDRAIRFGNIADEANIEVNNNVIINGTDDGGEVIKPGTIGENCTINLDYNYWSGKDAATAVVGGLPVPANNGINEGTWTKEITDAYVTNGKKAQGNNDNTWTVVDAEATVIETAKTTGATVTLNDLHAQSDVKLDEDATYKVVVATAPQADVEKANAKIAEEETGESKNTSKQIFDISVYKTDSQGTSKDVSSAISQQQVTITLGETPNANTVKVYHVGSTETEKISNITVKGNTITFIAPSFSTYAVTYTADDIEDNEISKQVGVAFERVDASSTYDIVLKALDGKKINRFMSADLTFALDVESGAVGYTVEPGTNIYLIDNNNGKYEFNLNGTVASGATGSDIVIGQVTFDGTGKIKFSVDTAVETNIVNSAKAVDNIVDYYTTAGDASTTGQLVLNENVTNGVIDEEFKAETADLTINIDFPNAIKDNANTYQKMTVTISGGDLTDNVVYNLGTDGDVALNADGKYVINVTDKLTKNVAYTVKVEGAGYRTARYTVNMTGAKTLNFWNNVKDTAINVDESVTTESTKKNVTFLAGDIVKDNQINIYDLSAVVSYFGTNNLVDDHQEYAKYDLNRDGKIDSKDIAYVLVSWGN